MISWYVRRFLEKIGVPEWKAFGIEIRIDRFEDWLFRHPLTYASITFDPKDCMNEWKEMSVSIDDFKFVGSSGIWRRRFVWQAKASPTKEVEKK